MQPDLKHSSFPKWISHKDAKLAKPYFVNFASFARLLEPIPRFVVVTASTSTTVVVASILEEDADRFHFAFAHDVRISIAPAVTTPERSGGRDICIWQVTQLAPVTLYVTLYRCELALRAASAPIDRFGDGV